MGVYIFDTIAVLCTTDWENVELFCSGAKRRVHEEPAWRRRKEAVRRAVSVALMKGLVSGGWSCCQGEAWFLSVRRRVLCLE